MAETGIFASMAHVVQKAGANANSTATASEAMINAFLNQAESKINVLSIYDWTASYAVLDSSVQGILTEAASNLAAMYVINYDMGGFTSRAEAETMLDVLKDGFNQALSLLKDIKKRIFMRGA